MMRNLFLIILAILLSACGASNKAESAQAVQTKASETVLPALVGDYVWNVDASKSVLQFRATEKGKEFTGTFGGFETVVRLDPEDLSDAEIHTVITLASVDASDNDRNSELRGGDWFDLKNFSTAAYDSTNIKKLEGNNYRADGNLTIKGRTMPVELSFSLNIDGDKAFVDGGTTINRIDFALGDDDYWTVKEQVGVQVDILLHIEANR